MNFVSIVSVLGDKEWMHIWLNYMCQWDLCPTTKKTMDVSNYMVKIDSTMDARSNN